MMMRLRIEYYEDEKQKQRIGKADNECDSIQSNEKVLLFGKTLCGRTDSCIRKCDNLNSFFLSFFKRRVTRYQCQKG